MGMWATYYLFLCLLYGLQDVWASPTVTSDFHVDLIYSQNNENEGALTCRYGIRDESAIESVDVVWITDTGVQQSVIWNARLNVLTKEIRNSAYNSTFLSEVWLLTSSLSKFFPWQFSGRQLTVSGGPHVPFDIEGSEPRLPEFYSSHSITFRSKEISDYSCLVYVNYKNGSVQYGISNIQRTKINDKASRVRRQTSNISLGKPAYSKYLGRPVSEPGGPGQHSPAKAVDGSFFNSNFSTFGWNPYLIIDLEDVYKIERINIYGVGREPTEFVIDILNMNPATVGIEFPYGDYTDHCVKAKDKIQGSYANLTCGSGRANAIGRYFSFRLYDYDNDEPATLTLREVVVYGEKVEAGGCRPDDCVWADKCYRQGEFSYNCVCKDGAVGKKCNKLRNVAYEKSAYMSSTQTGSNPDKGVDGNENGLFSSGTCFETKLEDKPWWAVDLSNEYAIRNIVIVNRQDAHSDRLANFQAGILMFAPMEKSTPRYGHFCGVISEAVKTDISISCHNHIGRYVIVQLRRNQQIFHACEIKVYGTIAQCARGICKNRAICEEVPTEASHRCHCAAGFTGENCEAKNLAYQKSASSSGVAHGMVAARVVDGNTNPDINKGSCFHSADNPQYPQEWLLVDLEDNYYIENITIYNRRGGLDRLRNFHVYAAIHRILFLIHRDSDYLCGKTDRPLRDEERLTFRCPRLARYISIINGDGVNSPSENRFGLCEVEVSEGSMSLQSECEKLPCHNGATCVELPIKASYQCQCAAGFTGRNCETRNLAYKKTASSSGTAHGMVAARVVDGNTNPDISKGSCFHSADNPQYPQEWLLVDLGDNYYIESVTIYNRRGSLDRLRNFHVYAAIHKIVFLIHGGSDYLCGKTDRALRDEEVLTFRCPRVARYISIINGVNSPSENRFGICEVEVLGSMPLRSDQQGDEGIQSQVAPNFSDDEDVDADDVGDSDWDTTGYLAIAGAGVAFIIIIVALVALVLFIRRQSKAAGKRDVLTKEEETK